MVPVGDKSKEVKARVRFTENSVQVQNSKTGAVLKELKYSDITAATYSKSKHPRWKQTLALGLAVGLFALPVLFTKSKKHWLTIQTSKKKDYILLRLDKKNFRHVITAVESCVDVEVERVEE